MANFNMKSIQDVVNELGMECQLIPSPTNEKNCKYIIVNGLQLKSSQWTKAEAESVLNDIKCGCYTDAKSVAKQKVNDAHGNTYLKSLVNFFNQESTYADGFEHLIQLKGKNLADVLECYKDLTENYESILGENLNEVNTWVKHVILWYTEDNKTTGMQKAKETIKRLINEKQVHIINGFVYTDCGLKQFVKNWAGENDIPTTPEKIEKAVNEWVRVMA